MRATAVLAFLLLTSFTGAGPCAAGVAMQELLASPGSGGSAAAVPADPPVSLSPALRVRTGPGGDIIVDAERAAPAGLRVLPDDTVREDPPPGPERLPNFPVNPAAQEKAAFNIDAQGVIPADLKAAAVGYYLANKDKIGNLRYAAVVDFSRHSSKARFFIADTRDGSVQVLHVAHGSGSDPDNDGFATIFSNTVDSNASSLGFYITGEIYTGKHGRSMRLHGLSATNSNAYQRAVVIHAADYVLDLDVQQGRSWGCLAVSKDNRDKVIGLLKGGALIYAGLSGSGR